MNEELRHARLLKPDPSKWIVLVILAIICLQCLGALRRPTLLRRETDEYVVRRHLPEEEPVMMPTNVPTCRTCEAMFDWLWDTPFSPYVKGYRASVAPKEVVTYLFYRQDDKKDSVEFLGEIDIKPSGAERDVTIPTQIVDSVIGLRWRTVILMRNGVPMLKYNAD